LVIGVCSIEIVIPDARSLKDKRRVIRRVVDRLRHRHNVSVSEVEHQDLWQRAGLALAAVGPSKKVLDAMFGTILDEIEKDVPGLVAGHEVEFF
jgi:hypothetical protein